MGSLELRRVRLTWPSAVYVAAVTLTAAVGFVVESPGPILLASLLALPASVVALPSYYVAFGLLALIPGANPSSGSGSGSAGTGPGGPEITVTSGDPAAWFTTITPVLGIGALGLAALVNVLVLQAVLDRRRARRPTVADPT